MEYSASVEVLLARGVHPSVQRNRAALACKGAILLFLDSDSIPQKDLAVRLVRDLAGDSRRAAAGGPNLPPLQEPPFSRAVSAVIRSFFGSAASRARYGPVGQGRESSEKELILCNLAVRRDVFIQAGGFREDLYPNEENEFLNRLSAEGWRLWYDPLARVRRPRRASWGAFALQAFRYGRGRGRQARVNFFPGDLPQFAPLAYGLALLLALASPGRALLFPALASAYLLLALAASLALLPGLGWRAVVTAPLLFVVRHGGYGLGLAAGLAGGGAPKPQDSTVRIERTRRRGRSGPSGKRKP